MTTLFIFYYAFSSLVMIGFYVNESKTNDEISILNFLIVVGSPLSFPVCIGFLLSKHL